MAKKYDFSERPDYDWKAPLERKELKQVEAEGHGWQPIRNEQYRMGVQIQEKLKRGEELTRKERGYCLILGITPDRVISMTHHGDWMLKHYGVKTSEARANPTRHAQVYVDFYEEFDLDIVEACAADCLVVDLSSMGVPTMCPVDGTDQPTALIIKNEKDVWNLRERIETNDLRKEGLMPERLETFKEMRRLSNDTLFLLPQINSPIGAAWGMCGHTNLSKWMKNKPQLVHLIMDTVTLGQMKIMDAWRETGVHAMQINGGVTGMPYFREWQGQEFITPYSARLVGYAWPFPCFEFGFGAAFTIGTDPQKYDPKLKGTEEPWLRWAMREWTATGALNFTNLASDCDIPPANNLARFRELALYFKKSYQVGIHNEEVREATPEFITRKMVKWMLDMHPCEGAYWVRLLFIDPVTPKENIQAFTNAFKEFGTFPIDKAKLERYLKEHPGPTISYEVKGLEGQLLKKQVEKTQVE